MCRLPTLAAVILAVCSAPAPAREATREEIRGITLSTHGGGRDWGSDGAAQALSEIAGLGANWVAIHPYARIDADGSVRFHRFPPGAPPPHLARPIREAHARGLKLLVKPHLAYWGSPFAWRGEIEFADDATWERFWRSYTEWIVTLAGALREADGFVVGTELDRTLRFEGAWRRLISEVRSASPVPLTYAANWTDFERVPFWDALDVIGIQAYFPISDSALPDRAALRAGWRGLTARLRDYASSRNRPIVFTELGYNRSHRAAREPWRYDVDGPEAEALQALCLATALESIEAEPEILGAFLWKWFPAPRMEGRNFQLATPRLTDVIRRAWETR